MEREIMSEMVGACPYRPLPPGVNSAVITDREFLEAIATVIDRKGGQASWWDLQEVLGMRLSVIKAKARRTYRRGLTEGCLCGCRGDLDLTTQGRASLAVL